MISTRARAIITTSNPLVEGIREVMKNPFHKTTNTGGIINLGTAQNHLLHDILKPKFLSSRNLPDDSFHYAPIQGLPALRQAIAKNVMQRNMNSNVTVDVANIAVAAGAGAVVDLLFFTLCNENDGVIVPTPYYGGFDADLRHRSHTKIIEAPFQAPQFELVVSHFEVFFFVVSAC